MLCYVVLCYVFNHTGRKKTVKQTKLAECINKNIYAKYIFLLWQNKATRAWVTSFLKFLNQVQLDTPHAVGFLWTRLSAHRRDVYLTEHNIHKGQTDIYIAGGNRTCNISKRATAADLPPETT